jgi:hypothetical protein
MGLGFEGEHVPGYVTARHQTWLERELCLRRPHDPGGPRTPPSISSAPKQSPLLNVRFPEG